MKANLIINMITSRMSKKDIKTFMSVSSGNKKLRSNRCVRFYIFNLPAKVTCPYATEMCKGSCYACKAERVYPSVLPARHRNFDATMTLWFTAMMIRFIELSIKWEKSHGNRLIWFRIHESGDFYNKVYVKKWLTIARHFESDHVIFHAYTKSFRFFDGVKLPNNFSLVASVWADTSRDQLDIINRNGWTVYTAYEKGCEPVNTIHCRCDDCGSCKECINHTSGGAVIACEIH